MRHAILTVLAVAGLAAPATAAADPGDVLVRYRSGTDAGERSGARQSAGVAHRETLPVAGIEVVVPDPARTIGQTLGALRRDPDVLYAEPDVPRFATRLPNDPRFGMEWGLDNAGQAVAGVSGVPDADIDAPEAWDVVTGSSGVLVAVIDTGMDAGHPDLAPNLYVNPREQAGNGVDDDGNGFVDDTSGWDFVGRDAAPADANGHGTHVAGTIAANGNDGIGVTGVAWDASLLPLRVLGANGTGTVSNIIRAYAYAAAAGARVVNLSLAGASGSQAERDALAAAPNVLFVAAAGNESVDNEQTPSFPCNYDLANVVCVAATDSADRLAAFSNTGAQSVDLAAPGVAVVSTWPVSAGSYAQVSGTSMATPHVSGAAALLAAQRPAAGPADLRASLLQSVDPKPALAGRVVTGGRLNVGTAVARVQQAEAAPDPAPADPAPPADPASPAAAATTAASAAIAPAVTPAPSALPGPADRTAPLLAVAPARAHDLAALLRFGLRVRVRCSEACALRLTLRRGATMLATATASRTGAGAATAVLRLSRAARARLRKAGRVRLVLRVEAQDGAGNKRLVVRPLTLRR